MLKRTVHVLLICLCGILNITMLNAQDIHYSQFYYANNSLNPALIGNIDGDHRITANYRHQWLTVPVPYLTLSGLYETVFPLRTNKVQISSGLLFDYDQAGDSKLSLSNLGLNIGAQYSPTKHHLIGLALQPSVAQRRFDEDNLKWDNQWDGEEYKKNLPSKESFASTGFFFFDLALGLNYTYKLTERTYISLGGAAYHLLQPDQSFYKSPLYNAKIASRLNGNASISIGIGNFLDLVLTAQQQTQGKYEETVAAGLLKWRLNNTPGQKLKIITGFGMRLDDAMIPSLGFEYNNWLVSGSYDINTSPFKIATAKRGGPEVVVRYTFRSVKDLNIYKRCQII